MGGECVLGVGRVDGWLLLRDSLDFRSTKRVSSASL